MTFSCTRLKNESGHWQQRGKYVIPLCPFKKRKRKSFEFVQRLINWKLKLSTAFWLLFLHWLMYWQFWRGIKNSLGLNFLTGFLEKVPVVEKQWKHNGCTVVPLGVWLRVDTTFVSLGRLQYWIWFCFRVRAKLNQGFWRVDKAEPLATCPAAAS